jgi:hypothetical protein
VKDIAEISEVPPKSQVSRLFGWMIPIAILCLIAYGFLINIQTGLEQLSAWVLGTA